MKCFVHQNVDAVGICSECGQGVCDTCAVRTRGRLYCNADVNRAHTESSQEVESTPKRVNRAEPMDATFYFNCREFQSGNFEGEGKEVEHYLDLKLEAPGGNWLITAIDDHDKYFPLHIMLGVRLGSANEIPASKLKAHMLRAGKSEYQDGQIDR